MKNHAQYQYKRKKVFFKKIKYPIKTFFKTLNNRKIQLKLKKEKRKEKKSMSCPRKKKEKKNVKRKLNKNGLLTIKKRQRQKKKKTVSFGQGFNFFSSYPLHQPSLSFSLTLRTTFSNNNKYKKIKLVVTFQNNAENQYLECLKLEFQDKTRVFKFRFVREWV